MNRCCRVTTPSQTAPTPHSTWPPSTGWCPTTPRSPATMTSPARARWWPTLPPPPTAVSSESSQMIMGNGNWSGSFDFCIRKWWKFQKSILEKICKGKMYMILLDALLVWRRGKDASEAQLKSNTNVSAQNLWIFEKSKNTSQARACLHTKHGTKMMPIWAALNLWTFSFLNVQLFEFWSKTDVSICGKRGNLKAQILNQTRESFKCRGMFKSGAVSKH